MNRLKADQTADWSHSRHPSSDHFILKTLQESKPNLYVLMQCTYILLPFTLYKVVTDVAVEYIWQ